MRVRLFGIDFSIATDGTLELPTMPGHLNVTTLRGEARQTGGEWRATLTFAGHVGPCTFDISLPVLRLIALPGASEALVPASDPLEDDSGLRFNLFQDSDPGSLWSLAVAGLRLVGTAPDDPLITTRNRLAMRFRHTPLFQSDQNALPIAAEGGAGGFVLDLGTGRLEATENALLARTGVEAVSKPAPGQPDPLFAWHGRSRAITVANLLRPADCTTVRFRATDPAAAFVLHADTATPGPVSAANPILAPLSVLDSDLDVTFRHRPGDEPRLDGLALVPTAADGQLLTAYAFSNVLNAASQWRVRDPLPLSVRAKSPDRPAGLAIAPGVAVGAVATDPGGVVQHGLHGIVGRTRVMGAGTATLQTEEIATAPAGRDDVTPALLYDTVLPRLTFAGVSPGALAVTTARPGETFFSDNGREASNFRMHGDLLMLPLIDRRHLHETRREDWDRHVRRVEAATIASQRRAHDQAAVHETNLSEPVLRPPANQFFERLFAAAADVVRLHPTSDTERPAPRIATYATRFDYRRADDNASAAHTTSVARGIHVNLHVKPDQPDYMVIRADGVEAAFDSGEIGAFVFDPSGNFKPTGALPRGFPDDTCDAHPAAIVKLTRKQTLAEIFAREGFSTTYAIPGMAGRSVDLFDDLLPADIKGRTWTGLIVFRLPILSGSNAGSEPGLAAQLIGNAIGEELELAYLSISPARSAGGASRTSYNGRVIWENGRDIIDRSTFEEPDGQHNPQDRRESRFQLNHIHVTWADGALSDLRIDTQFHIDSLFGVRHLHTTGGTPSRRVTISGRYDQDERRVRFLAELSEPWQIFPFTDGGNTLGPLRRLTLSSIEIAHSWDRNAERDRLAIVLDGDLELSEFTVPGLGGFDGFDLGHDSRIDFKGLDLFLPPLTTGLSLCGDFLEFGYPSMRINLDLTPFRIGPIGLKLKSIGMSWDGEGIDWEAPLKLVGAGNFDIRLPTLFFDLRLDLGALAELALKSADKLLLDLQVGLQGRGGGLWDRIEIGLSAVEFRRFELDLTRFLTISADSVYLRSETVTRNGQAFRYTKFFAGDVKVLILGRKVVENLMLALFMTPSGRVGILAYIPGGTGGFLNIRWVLIGRDVLVGSDLAARIMSVEVLGEGEDERIANDLARLGGDGGLLPLELADQPIGDWVFAAGFGFGGLLDGRFLFQDRRYYGLAVGGGIFRDWFGFDFALSVLYEKGPTPSQDRVVISIRAPKVVLPTFAFLGGVISLRVDFNGGFLLDCGFPWRQGGERLWNRTFGAIVTPFQASGGFYVRRENVVVPLGRDLVAAGGGYAVQGGLGASFGGGVFSVWVTVGIYSVIEGVVVLSGDTLRAFRLTGAVGVLLRGGGELNFWIISVRVEIVVGAEASLTLIYRADNAIPDLSQIGIPATVAPGRPMIRVDFLLYARASARACIGSGWFKLCKSISVSVPMRARYDLRL